MSTSRPSSTELQQQFDQILEEAKKVIKLSYLKTYKVDLQDVYERALALMQKAKVLGIALDLHLDIGSKILRSEDGVTILTLAFAVNDLKKIDELLADKYNCHYYACSQFSMIKSYEAVQLLLKHDILQDIKKSNHYILDELKLRSEFITLADIRELNPFVQEPECKELTLAESNRSKKIVEFNKDIGGREIVDQACFGIYNLGVKVINKDKRLLVNYNRLPQTYSNCVFDRALLRERKSCIEPYTGQLKTLYVLRLGLDNLRPEVIWELFRKSHALQSESMDRAPICYPTGAKFVSFEAVQVFLELYICHNLKRFASIREKVREEFDRIDIDRAYQSAIHGIGRFTGSLPGYQFINRDNIRVIYEAIFASEPKLDLFKLAQDKTIEQKEAQGTHLFVRRLFEPMIGFFSSKTEEKKLVIAPTSLKSSSVVEEYKNGPPGGPSFT